MKLSFFQPTIFSMVVLVEALIPITLQYYYGRRIQVGIKHWWLIHEIQ